ncbi:Acyl-coenzyme A synthetase/AMP-(fatty) acid ligase [Kushneria avicenniae]|uniref:Acyl-coenzyme A synthetase/AMP-(Fatty) acid ligase n=1 Tax=Kushneria avicenniae TaxID=402385 RepID=A0A1I1I406_9GAMM|nr:AMP-binding protein [Kushneria avicenniae]SFC30944.1 Acyl-coenzyme A synthetase/AMP-(fatty) acid ligase [Kushneria avicenniae]
MNAHRDLPPSLTRCPWLSGADSDVVACSGQTMRTRGELREAIRAWASLSLPEDRDVALYDSDPWRFTATLLGLWHAGRRVWLPGDNLPETVDHLRRRHLILLGELPEAPPAPPPATGFTLASTLSPDHNAVVLFTSGSSGEPTPIFRTLGQLESEVAAFERHWPLGKGVVISQVSHQHTWGLTAGLLRALATSHPFGLSIVTWPETLAEWLMKMPVSALISSPPQLSRLPGAAIGMPDHGPGRLFSAAAPLDHDAAVQAERLMGSELTEIYGSSESGAIAWRRPSQDTTWQALDDVRLRCDGERTLLRSNRLPDPEQWHEQADHIHLLQTHPPRFTLHGRADRIVKVGGKRVSLEGLAHYIEAFPGVLAARCLTIDHSGGRIGAVIAMAREGIARDHDTRRALISALRQHLADAFEPVVLPRFWRFVETLPVNAQGKLTHTMARHLFDDLDDRRQPRWLDIESPTPDQRRITLEIPERLAALKGHFPERPIVPGIALIHWARQQAERLFGARGQWRDMRRVRFPAPLLPGDRAVMTLTRQHDALNVSVTSHRGQHLQLRLLSVASATDDPRESS